ncbi:MAG: YbaN family protein [Fimbriimonadaceae bacterium]|nr:YbaN family protein [Fimbriimonadaceae bacterium]
MPATLSRHASSRVLYTVLGWLFVGIGIVGYVLPVLPGTVFMILALWCFRRGSERFERWLLNQPRIGPTLRDWDENRAIKPRTKVIAIAMVWVCIGGSLFAVKKPWVGYLLVGIAVALSWYLATRRKAVALQEPVGELVA